MMEPPRANGFGDATQEQQVLAWLKSRGLWDEASRLFQEERQQQGQQGGVNSVLFRSLQANDPEVLQNGYSELQSWICQALEAYKQELLTISFPLFVHCYLKLVQRGFTAEASAFLKTWGSDHTEQYPLEMRALTAVQTVDQIQGQDFTRRALQERLVLHLSSITYGLLEGFLNDHNLLSLIQILNERVKVVVEERAPRERFQVVTFESEDNAGAGGGGIIRDASGVRWRVFRGQKPPPGLEAQAPVETGFNHHLYRKLSTRAERMLIGSWVPQTDAPAAQALKPTVMMSTVTNTYDGLICARHTDEGTQLACGFQDRTVRVFRMLYAEVVSHLEHFDTVPSTQTPPQQTDSYRGPMVLRGHSRPVHGLSWSPSQQHVVSCSADGTVRLWDVAYGRNVGIYRGPSAFPVWDVAFAPVGHFMVAGSHDRVARIWTTNRTQPVRMLVGHYSDVTCVAWHPNCNYVVTGSWDKTARLWDVQTGKCVRIYSGHLGPLTCVTVSPDGHYVAAAGTGGGQMGVVRIWEISTGAEVACLEGHKAAVHKIAFSADGRALASGGGDKTVRTWDLHSCFTDMSSSTPAVEPITLRTKGTPVLDVLYTSRNLLLAAGPS